MISICSKCKKEISVTSYASSVSHPLGSIPSIESQYCPYCDKYQPKTWFMKKESE